MPDENGMVSEGDGAPVAPTGREGGQSRTNERGASGERAAPRGSASRHDGGETGGKRATPRSAGRAREDEPSEGQAELERLRDEVLACDRDIVDAISRRRALVRKIGRIKRRLGLPVTDPAREAAVARRAAEMARAADIDERLVRDVVWKVMASARGDQEAPRDAGERVRGGSGRASDSVVESG